MIQSKNLGPKSDKDTIEVKIGDLGNASYCWKHFTENIQTRQYRCPEVILGAEWDATADVWSVGCIVSLFSCFAPRSSCDDGLVFRTVDFRRFV